MAKTNLITPQGELVYQQELQQLWKVERPIVCQAVSDAAKQGDRSENGDYIYGKRRLREIDRRVRFLKKRLEVLTVVTQLPTDQQKVYFGAWVTVVSEDDSEQLRFRIVGPDEFDQNKEYISIDSPMAQALLGKQLDDAVFVKRPKGDAMFYIEQIDYLPVSNG